MAIIRRDGWLWNIFASLMGLKSFEGGEIMLAYGKHVITVPTCNKPKKVWLTVSEPCGSIPVCCGDISMVGAKTVREGIIISADIKTDTAIVQWFIE